MNAWAREKSKLPPRNFLVQLSKPGVEFSHSLKLAIASASLTASTRNRKFILFDKLQLVVKIKWARLSKVVDELKLIDTSSRQGQPSFIAQPASNHLMDFFAHTENNNGSWHKLADHLRGVGRLAAEFAAQIKPELIEAARWARLLHDFEDEL